MPNPNKHVATIKIARVAGGTEVYLKSEVLENKIKRDASAGPILTREFTSPPAYWPIGLSVYRVELPDCNGSYLISPEPTEEGQISDILHLVRAVGLGKGVKLTLAMPLSVSKSQLLAKQLRDYLKHVYEEYYTDVSIEYTIVEQSVEVTTENGWDANAPR